MRKVLMIALSAATLAAGIPAAQARPHDNDARSLTATRKTEIRNDVRNLRAEVDRAAARRIVSAREASGLRRQADQVRQLYARYAQNGLTRTEVQTLQARVNQVRMALRSEGRDRNGRRG